MNLFTKIDIPQSKFKIDYTSNLLFLGSCFAENISKKFQQRKFHTLTNPLGMVYNPLSIENLVAKLTSKKDEPWSRWDYQGEFSNEELGRTIKETKYFLKGSDAVFITLGTAFVYFLKESHKAVANCHKEPAALFERRLISVDEAAGALENVVKMLWDLRKEDKTHAELKIIFTVSPLRHLNDTAHGNNLSKATLLLAVKKVCQEFENVSYFPSYEIVMDELRDYRFYADDLIHLSVTAEDYIFERMYETFCSSKTLEEMQKVEKFMQTLSHRIIDAGSLQTKTLAKQQIAKAKELENQIKGIDLSKEKERWMQFI